MLGWIKEAWDWLCNRSSGQVEAGAAVAQAVGAIIAIAAAARIARNGSRAAEMLAREADERHEKAERDRVQKQRQRELSIQRDAAETIANSARVALLVITGEISMQHKRQQQSGIQHFPPRNLNGKYDTHHLSTLAEKLHQHIRDPELITRVQILVNCVVNTFNSVGVSVAREDYMQFLKTQERNIENSWMRVVDYVPDDE